MGLDVYLYKCDNLPLKTKLEAEFYEKEQTIWDEYPKYDAMTEAQKEEALQRVDALAVSMGLTGEYNSYPEDKIKLDSIKYPDNFFKIGYFRSSYNDGGFNPVMRRQGLPDIYALFGEEGEPDNHPTDWEGSRPRVVDAIAKYRALMDTPVYDAFDVSPNMFGSDLPESAEEAVRIYRKETDGEHAFDGWSSRAGTFMPKGEECYGFIPGKLYGRPCTYVVFKRTEKGLTFYLEALEIMLETIDYVLAQPDRDKFTYYLNWSG